MFSKKAVLGVVLATGLAVTANAQGLSGRTAAVLANSGILTIVAVVGPQGEVISYEKSGEEIIIRPCAKNTLPSEIEYGGCILAGVPSDVRMSEADFRSLVLAKLSTLNTKDLSAEQKKLLEQALSADPNADEDARNLTNLEGELSRNQAFKKEFPDDYDAKEEQRLKIQIQCIKDRQNGYAPILKAKKDVSDLLNTLVDDMGAEKVKRTLRYSQDKTGIAFNVLKEIATVDACDPGKVARAASGYMCRAGGVMWKVENETYANKRVYRDMKSGLKVTEPLDGTSNHDNAASRCKDGYWLPSGYLTLWNGDYGFPNQDSEFVTLRRDGVRSVVPGMKEHWFWSSSVNPGYSYSAYYFRGGTGDISIVARETGDGSIICVSDR